MALSVGSPALAAYSLILTSLNARSVYERAKRCKHENRVDVAKALISLQQTPLELTTDERLLAYIPINHHWRHEIADRLNRRNAWSIATGTSVAWVVIAFLLTLVDSFVSLETTGDEPSEGQAVGTLWLWLLCLVIGWLWVPTFTSGELNRAIRHANRQAVKKAAKKIKEKANKAISSTKNKLTARFSKRMPNLKGLKKPDTEPVVGAHEKAEGSIREDTKEVGDGIDTTPNLLSVPTHEGQQDHDHLGVNTNQTASHSVLTLPRSIAGQSVAQSSIHPEKDSLLIFKDLGPLNRDERRGAATFNYSRIMRYLVLVDDVLRALDKLAREREEVRVSVEFQIPEVISSPWFSTEKEANILRHRHSARGEPYVPPWSPHYDVQRFGRRPHSPVWNNCGSHRNRGFHPRNRFGMPFFRVRNLRGASDSDLVLHHHLHGLRPHLGNPEGKFDNRQKHHGLHRHRPPQDLPLASLDQHDGVDTDILSPVFKFPR